MPTLSFQKIVVLADLLNETLKPKLAEMPHLAQESADIDGLLTEVKSLDREQETLTGRLREIVRLRRAAEKRGYELRSRVAAQIQGKLGFTNENLRAFGITPRKVERKKPGEKKKAPPAVASTASGASSSE
jgi:hypothetical protein